MVQKVSVQLLCLTTDKRGREIQQTELIHWEFVTSMHRNDTPLALHVINQWENLKSCKKNLIHFPAMNHTHEVVHWSVQCNGKEMAESRNGALGRLINLVLEPVMKIWKGILSNYFLIARILHSKTHTVDFCYRLTFQIFSFLYLHAVLAFTHFSGDSTFAAKLQQKEHNL